MEPLVAKPSHAGTIFIQIIVLDLNAAIGSIIAWICSVDGGMYLDRAQMMDGGVWSLRELYVIQVVRWMDADAFSCGDNVSTIAITVALLELVIPASFICRGSTQWQGIY